jgi:hypothetical protein
MLPVVIFAVIIIIYISSLDWKRSVKAVLFLVVIEGALRKWVLPQASELMYFLKDFVLLGAYIRYYGGLSLQRKFALKNNPINLLIVLAALWCIFQAFNPSLGSIFIGIFGLKAYLFYIPLIWMVPNLFESESELYNFLRFYLLLTIPVGCLGIAQFFSPPNSPINIYAPGQEAVGGIATFSSFARITGTFAYINNYTAYLIVCFGLLISLLSIYQPYWWKLATIVEILFVTVNQFMSGSRGPVITSVLFVLGYLGAKLLTQPYKALRFIRQFLIAGVVVAIVAFIWFRPAVDAFWVRTTSNTDVSGRIEGSLVEPFNFMKFKDVDGYGTGATQVGNSVLRRVLNLPPGEQILVYYETEMGRIALDLGPLGFVLWYALRISLIIALWRVFWQLRRFFLKELALAAFLIQAIQILGQIVTLHTFAVYYWFFSGFIFLLPRLDKMEYNWTMEKREIESFKPTQQ